MKKNIFFTLLTLSFLLSCSSDSDTETPCTPIACLNNGISNSECGCDCPQGFTGVNCAIQSTPTTIKITKIKVKYFPNTDNGSSWDSSFPVAGNAWPDIFLTLENSNSSIMYSSPTYYANAVSNGTNSYDFIPTTPINIPFIYFNTLKLNLYDFDGADSNEIFGTNELMTTTFFDIYNTNSGFPTIINVGNTSTPIVYELTLQYVW